MKGPSKKTESPHFLSGWKEIANYLGKGVRTVQRYESEAGLPVRRPARNPSGGAVLATKAELDGWVSASPIREAFRLRDLDTENPSPARAINKGVSEMKRLREEMFALRNQMNATVRILQDHICQLQGELNRSTWKDYSPLYSRDEKDSLVHSAVDLTAPRKHLKAQ